MKLTTHLHLVPRSEIHEAIYAFPKHVFMAWCLITEYVFTELCLVKLRKNFYLYLSARSEICPCAFLFN